MRWCPQKSLGFPTPVGLRKSTLRNGPPRITLHTSWVVTEFLAAHSHIQRPLRNTAFEPSSHCKQRLGSWVSHSSSTSSTTSALQESMHYPLSFHWLSKSIPFWATSATSKVASLNLSQALLSGSQALSIVSATDRCRCRCSKAEITARLSTNVGSSHRSSHRSHGSRHGSSHRGLRIWIMATWTPWHQIWIHQIFRNIWYDAVTPKIQNIKSYKCYKISVVQGFKKVQLPFSDMFCLLHFEAFTAAPIPKSPPASTNLDGNWWETRFGKPTSNTCCHRIGPYRFVKWYMKKTMLGDPKHHHSGNPDFDHWPKRRTFIYCFSVGADFRLTKFAAVLAL